MDDIDRIIGDQIAARRRAMALTREQFGKKAGISCEEIHLYEAGRSRVPPGQLSKLADALEVDIAFFFLPAEEKAAQTVEAPDTNGMDETCPQTCRDEAPIERSNSLERAMQALATIKSETLRQALVTIIEAIARVEADRDAAPSSRGA